MFPRFSVTRFSFALGALAALLISLPAHAADIVYSGGGALSQIVDGGGTHTIFTLINLDSSAAPYTLYFYDDNGNPLPLSTTTTTTTSSPAGAPSTSVTGTLPPLGSVIFTTDGSSPIVVEGWAFLVTDNTIAGSAVFGIPLNSLYVEASCPLDTGANMQFGLPFDSTTAVTGIAIANSWMSSTPLTIGVTVYDINGNQLLTDTVTLPGNGHTSFLLTTRYPQLATQQGFVIFTGSYYMTVLGLRATATTFTSVTPIVASGW
jgi:hypothetical protein